MSEIWKGTVGPVLLAEEPMHEASTGESAVDVTYQGSRNAIFGLTPGFEAQGVSYRISQSGPVYTLTARIPTALGIPETPPDRYEISTESTDKSIFEHPGVVAEMLTYDGLISEDAETYKARAERFVSKGLSYDLTDVGYPLFGKVVRHLRNSASGFQIDFLVLRRFRKVALDYGNSPVGRISLDSGLFIYSTGQLNLPQDIAFTLPATPSDPSSDYSWGWRKRGQRVEIMGNYAEQTVELVFAPWSTLLYEDATGDLSW